MCAAVRTSKELRSSVTLGGYPWPCLRTPGLGLDYGPATTTKLDGERFSRYLAQHLLVGRPPPCWDLDRFP